MEGRDAGVLPNTPSFHQGGDPTFESLRGELIGCKDGLEVDITEVVTGEEVAVGAVQFASELEPAFGVEVNPDPHDTHLGRPVSGSNIRSTANFKRIDFRFGAAPFQDVTDTALEEVHGFGGEIADLKPTGLLTLLPDGVSSQHAAVKAGIPHTVSGRGAGADVVEGDVVFGTQEGLGTVGEDFVLAAALVFNVKHTPERTSENLACSLPPDHPDLDVGTASFIGNIATHRQIDHFLHGFLGRWRLAVDSLPFDQGGSHAVAYFALVTGQAFFKRLDRLMVNEQA
jgi:hypothetical protein